MGIQVNRFAIADHLALRRAQGRDDADLWAQLVGYWTSEDSHAAVLAAVQAAGVDCALAPQQSAAGGTLLRLRASDVERAIRALRALDASRGGDGGMVGALEGLGSVLSDLLQQSGPRPTLMTVLRMDPPVAAGPFNEYGQFDFRWSVPPGVRGPVFARVSQWLEAAGDGAVLADLEVCQEDLREVMERAMGQRPFSLTLTASDLVGRLRRATFGPWGQLHLVDVTAGMSGADAARALAGQLLEDLPGVEVACVTHASPLAPSWGNSRWEVEPHLWTSHLPAVHGIQLVTSCHLDKAHDLSGWQVRDVGDGRWLVSARDLAAWYPDASSAGTGWPDPELVSRAEEEFGAMLLTREVADHHPKQPT